MPSGWGAGETGLPGSDGGPPSGPLGACVRGRAGFLFHVTRDELSDWRAWGRLPHLRAAPDEGHDFPHGGTLWEEEVRPMFEGGHAIGFPIHP